LRICPSDDKERAGHFQVHVLIGKTAAYLTAPIVETVTAPLDNRIE
jgi:hypothetical protein